MKKYSQITRQLGSYAGVASIGLIIDFLVIIFAKEVLEINYLVSITLGFIFGLTFTYLLSRKYVFGASKLNAKSELLLFIIIGICGLIILDILVWVQTDWFGVNYIVSKSIATIAVFFWNFFARRTLYNAR